MSRPPHPLVSCGASFIGNKSPVLSSKIDTATSNIFDEFLSAPSKNPMSVGSGSVRCVSQDKQVLYKPHNYKLYFDFSKNGLLLPQKKGLYTRGSVTCSFRIINSVEPEFSDFFGCRVVVHKKTIEITNKLDFDKWYPIKFGSRIEIEGQVRSVVEQKDIECRAALNRFLDIFGGFSKGTIINVHSEEKIMSEDFIDMIPRKMKLHSPLVKKVYEEPNVEFNDSVSVVNYLENRAIESVAPDIVYALKLLALKVTPALEKVKEKIAKLDDVFSLENEIYVLPLDDRLVLSEWIALKFQGVA